MNDVNCPYCLHPQDINHDDGYGYHEGVKHQQQCVKCNKTFVFETSISFYYEVEKADCLNGGEHDWKLQKIFPERYADMECTSCGKMRPATDEENPHKLPPTPNQ
jgi:hypothetical protein